MASGTTGLEDLIGKDLSIISFVLDYLQFEFQDDRKTLRVSAFTPVSVSAASSHAAKGGHDFARLLVAQINKRVASVSLTEGDSAMIWFSDGSSITISLREDDYVGPEALTAETHNGLLVV